MQEGKALMMPPTSLPLVETPTLIAWDGGSAVTLTNIFSRSRKARVLDLLLKACEPFVGAAPSGAEALSRY